MKQFHRLVWAAFLATSLPTGEALAADWSVAGTLLSPSGIIPDGTLSISGRTIASVGPSDTTKGTAIRVPGIILPGFIDLHDHLTWNVLPRWLPGRKFANRYEWQDTAEYDRVLSNPHTLVLGAAACESEIYAELKALAGGATSVLGGLLRDDKNHPENQKCVAGLARNLDTDSGLPFVQPKPDDGCPTKPDTNRSILDVVDNEVFPLELAHDRFDFLLCELGAGSLRGLVVHLSEGASNDSSAHREYSMLSKEVLLGGKDGKAPVNREGLVLIHGTALRDVDFAGMKSSSVGLIWSPRSNDELYGSTTNIIAARQAGVPIAIAPDWSPSGSAGMLQEIGYVSRHYGTIGSSDLLAMAISVPAKLVRVADRIGDLSPGKFADFIVVNVNVDPTKASPLDPVIRATPADISLVVVDGKPIYGDKSVLKQFLPAGAETNAIRVCGAEKAVYLGDTEAINRHWTLDDIKLSLQKALAKAGSTLPEIECD